MPKDGGGGNTKRDSQVIEGLRLLSLAGSDPTYVPPATD